MGSALNDDGIFRFLVEHSPDGHFIVLDERFAYLNPAALAMFGYSLQEFHGLSVPDILDPSEHDRCRRNMALRAEDKLKGATTYLARRSDGTTFPIEVHGASLDFGGRRGLHGVIRDITSRRKMEDRLERLERSHLAGRLASGIAHDFNNLLAVIQANSEAVQRQLPEDQDVQAAMKRIAVAVRRGTEKVRHVRQIGGGASGGEGFRPLHVNPIVEDIIDLTRARWRDEAEAAGIHYDVRWEPGQPPACEGSVADLRAALVALVFNAMEAMPGGGPLGIRTGKSPSGGALIEVEDAGEGISASNLPRLTDAFFTTRSDRQMGLGLHLVQSVMARHGGRLEVDSAKGRGARFSLHLPAPAKLPSKPAPAPRVELLERTRLPTAEGAPRPRTRGGRSVLLVDDQPDLVQVIVSTLEERGFSVDAALNGKDAVAFAEASRYSVVLTDLAMPDMSGWEVSERIAQIQPKTPILLMTGWTADVEDERLEQHGIHGLLPKPFRADQLFEAIREALEKG